MRRVQKKTLAILLVLLLVLGIIPTTVLAEMSGTDATQTIDLSIQSALDDMEEWLTKSGAVDDASTDLEIGVEKPGKTDPLPQLVGLRFAGLEVPQGAQITNAYIQFTSDPGDTAKSTDPLDITIRAQDADDAASFAAENYSVSSRATTSQSVSWTATGGTTLWTNGQEAGENQRTPDLSTLVQAVVDRSGWDSGNAIALMLEGTGNRTALSYETGADVAPVLHVEYQAGPEPTVSPTAEPTATPSPTATATPQPTNTPAPVTYSATDVAVQPGSDETQLNFCWYGAAGVTTAAVKIAPASEMNGDIFPATAQVFTGTVAASGSFSSNEVTVTGLSPSTEYVYSLGDGTSFGETHHVTIRDASSYSALLVGDPQIGSSGSTTNDTAGWVNAVNTAMNQFPGTSFILSAGDQVQNSDNEAQYAGFFSPSQLAEVPLVSTIGNHDNSALYKMHYNSPNESSTLGTTSAGGDYWFTYGKTLYMVLNSNNTTSASHETFISQAIAANASRDIKWRVVMFHHSIYSSASHSNESSIIARRNTLAPIFDSYDIDVVLMGHDHCYTRSYQMKNGEAVQGINYDTKGRAINPDGTLYITANSGSGSKYYDFQSWDSAYASFRWQGYTPSYSNIEVTDTTVAITTYKVSDGSVIDTYTIVKDSNYSGELQPNFYYLTQKLNEQIGSDHTNPVYVLDADDYTAASWDAYVAAISAALLVEQNASATQAQIDEAKDNLIAARDALVELNSGSLDTYFVTLQPGSDETGMNFSWATATTSGDAYVQYARTSDMIDRFTFPASSCTAVAQTTQLASDIYSNKASVTGLEPGVSYSYRVGDSAEASKVYTFTTGSSSGYSALFVGDPQIGASGNSNNDATSWSNTLSAATANVPEASLLLSAGDQVEDADDEEQYLGFLNVQELLNLPISPTIGNHDNNILYRYVFNLANESTANGVTDAGGDNWFVYGNTLYMVLNSNNTNAAQHQAFIQDAIAANAAKDIKWRVVMFHHSIYSSAVHSVEASIANLRNALYPVFDSNDIDAVLMGHDHAFTRSYQMLGGEAQKEQLTDGQGRVINPTGTLYITGNSASGSKYYDLQATPETYAAVRSQLQTPTYSSLVVTGDTFTVNTYRVDTGEIVDTYTIYKGDTAGIASLSLTADKNSLTKISTDSVTLSLSAVDNAGNTVDLSGAAVSYESSAPELVDVDNNGKVTLKDASVPEQDVQVWALVSVNGLQLKSNSVTIHLSTGSIVSRVSDDLDDMEEMLSTGEIDEGSSDLEICEESPKEEDPSDREQQIVGIRFANLTIPKGATITGAYIQFTADPGDNKKSTDPFDVTIWAQDSDDAASFANESYTVSSRTKTTQSVSWTATGGTTLWKNGEEAGVNQRTPDLSTLVQAVVDREGWTSGNAIALIMTGTGNRTAHSRDGKPSAAPVLYVTYTCLQKQDAPTGLTGVVATTVDNNDGKITGVTLDMEYQKQGDADWTAVTGTEIAPLNAGVYLVRYAEKEGYEAGATAEVTVPEYDGFALSIGDEVPAGQGYQRTILARQSGTATFDGKYFAVLFTPTSGKQFSVVNPAAAGTSAVSYQKPGTKVEVWLVDRIPNHVGPEMEAVVYAYAVSYVPVKSIKLDYKKLTLYVGDQQKLSATIKPADATNKDVAWTSGNEAIAKVDENGVVTAMGAGSVVITAAAADGKSATCRVTVKKVVKVTGVKLNKNAMVLLVGQNSTLKATVLPANATNKNVVWSSSKPSVAKVNNNGVVTGRKTGYAFITVTTEDGGYTSTCLVLVFRSKLFG